MRNEGILAMRLRARLTDMSQNAGEWSAAPTELSDLRSTLVRLELPAAFTAEPLATRPDSKRMHDGAARR
jgi:hypothetical protein